MSLDETKKRLQDNDLLRLLDKLRICLRSQGNVILNPKEINLLITYIRDLQSLYFDNLHTLDSCNTTMDSMRDYISFLEYRILSLRDDKANAQR